jgi:tetratricopeptide (TPR) repeat protein
MMPRWLSPFLLPLLPLLAPGAALRAQDPGPATQPPAASPPSPDALRQRAIAAEQRGQFGEAGDAYRDLFAAEPLRSDWLLGAARCLGRAGRYKDALNLLDGARARFPGTAELPAMIARTLLMQAESDRSVVHPEILWADAADFASQALAIDANDEDARLVLAQARYLAGDRDEAVRQAEAVTQRHPQRPGAHILLGRIAFDEFVQLLRERDTVPLEGQADADRNGAIAALRQRLSQAFGTAIQLDPQRAHPHGMLGRVAWLDRRIEAARAHFADALVLDPNQGLDHDSMLADLTPAQRIEFYQQLRTRRGDRGPAGLAATATLWFHEGRMHFDAGDWQRAHACFTTVQQGNPAERHADWYLFLCSYHLDRHDDAERHAVRYAAHSAPGMADVVRGLDGDRRGQVTAILQYLADRAWQQKHVPASRDLNHVIACLADSADAWNNHAFLCRETGAFEAAYASYQHAIEKEPDSAQLWNDAAVVLHYHLATKEHLAKARTMYEKAIVLAETALRDQRLTGDARQRTEQARADATSNLRALGKP